MYNLDKCILWLKSASFEKVCLQVSDDFLEQSAEIILQLQKTYNAYIYLVGSTVYESCCKDKLSLKRIQADACINIGHTCFSDDDDLPTYYVFPKSTINTHIFLNEFYDKFPDADTAIILFYHLSYLDVIETIYESLKIKYSNIILSRINDTTNLELSNAISNTILGRGYILPEHHHLGNYHALYIGSRDETLTVLALTIATSKWYFFDECRFHEFNVTHLPWLRRKSYLLEKIKDAQTFGLVIDSVNLKEYLNIVKNVKQILKKMNKIMYVFGISKITPIKLANFPEVDVFVLISCPESSLSESRDYFKPIVTPIDIQLAFGKSDYVSIPYIIDYKSMLSKELNHDILKKDFQTDASLITRTVTDNLQLVDLNAKLSCSKTKCNSIKHSNFEISSFRSKQWDGLSLKSTIDVNSAVSGRSGIPTKYLNETMHKDNL